MISFSRSNALGPSRGGCVGSGMVLVPWAIMAYGLIWLIVIVGRRREEGGREREGAKMVVVVVTQRKGGCSPSHSTNGFSRFNIAYK